MFKTKWLPIIFSTAGLIACPLASAQDATPPAPVQGSASGLAPPASGSQPNVRRTAQTQVQQLPGSVSGRVTTLDGEPIIGARIDIAKVGSPKKRFEVETDREGNFSFPQVEPGNWRVFVSAAGMLSHDQPVVVASNESSAVNVSLEDIEAPDVLRVTGKRTLIHPENIGTRTNLGRRFLNEYGSGNDLRKDIQSTPGVVKDSLGNIITRGEHNAVNYEIDGVVLPEAAGVLNQSQFASPRSLESVNVDIGGYQASDGGGPLGAVVRMRSLPMSSKPEARVGLQLGGPIQGGLNYYGSAPLSQSEDSLWNRVRVQSSGVVYGTSMGIESPVREWKRNTRFDINTLTKVEFKATEKDTFKLTVGLNGSGLGWPTSRLSRQAGVKITQYDRQDFVILGYRRLGEKYFDEANLNIVNAFYSTRLWSRNVFDPRPILVGEEPLLASTAPTATRFNYIMSAQGDIRKKVRTHRLQAGFLSEIRPVQTRYGAWYYNTNPGEVAGHEHEAGDEAEGAHPPIGALISPFTRSQLGPSFMGTTGNYKGFRYLQSAYVQDVWRPDQGRLKRLTVDAGARFDLYHGVFGNTMGVANAMLTAPGIQFFDVNAFKKQTITNAQVSGRFGAAYALTNNTALRASYSQIFQPPPVDLFATPPNLTEEPVNGIYPGTLRPLQATKGWLVDSSIEQQIGPRFALRTNLFYKHLKNFGDSGVVQNTPLYNRVSLGALRSYGVETRMDLKPARDGHGLNGFVSSTVGVAELTNRTVNGGVYEFHEHLGKYPDHDRRLQMVAGLGYRHRSGFWALSDVQVLTGVKNQLDRAIFGPHPARTPVVTLVGLNMGYDLPKAHAKEKRYLPSGVDVRIENLLNQTRPLNLGSPFQGTRYALPIRVIAGMYWKV